MGQEIDGRTDQYALAATAYHLLTGSQLSPHSLVERPVGHAALNSVLATALANKPDDRFPKCVDFARALTLAQIDGRTGTASKRPGQATTQPGARAKRATATRPTTSVPPATTPDDSVYIPHDAGDAGGRGGAVAYNGRDSHCAAPPGCCVLRAAMARPRPVSEWKLEYTDIRRANDHLRRDA